jgi:hypothetical protein
MEVTLTLSPDGTVTVTGASRTPHAVQPGESATIHWPGYVLTMITGRDGTPLTTVSEV